MNKLKKLKIKATTGWLLFGLAVIVSAGLVFAYSGDAPNIVIEGDYIEAPETPLETPIIEDEMLGGSMKWSKQGNRVTWIESGKFADKSVVLFSILNPVDYGKATSTDATYNAATHEVSTSTVRSINLDITGVATSTTAIICGGASTATAEPTYELLNLTLPTSTPGVFNNNQATTTDGLGVIGTGSATQILLTHDYDYFNCIATGTPATVAYWDTTAVNGVIGTNNTFDGTYSVEIIKNLQ
uniref:Uncharacterized protein n=1 Tax=viral metagenome TaxID=1070528 RepID=A0A6H1ZRT6_9ZZZZ